ncbi:MULTISPECIES: isochorismatase family protein [unclassified Halomonas]|uniref:isochorismatase family protein n=1 Tax=unclassified Halomonas TaxID=2609666 RepID=UPI0006D9D10F|nr:MULTISPECIES: isochorismatase family protein [unclassified Halomonas]KPQ21912.1 MAG: Amidase [Halomonas sp. HL-93]SBR46186.1 Isochorismatase family protein [Halomonas sp. HL-93]SNY98625.1 Isochorismatase family protein [Halomonas sp. hl-4]
MRLQRDKSLLLMVDFQAGLLPAIDGGEAAISEAHWLFGVADALAVPVWLTEQMPEKLGGTALALLEARQAPTIWQKQHFGIMEEAVFREALHASGRHQVVLCGTEAHICVLQTALGLLAEGYAVYWLSEATASRRAEEAMLARERACALGAQAVSADMVAYEWLHRCDTASFSAVHQQFLKPRAAKAVRFF